MGDRRWLGRVGHGPDGVGARLVAPGDPFVLAEVLGPRGHDELLDDPAPVGRVLPDAGPRAAPGAAGCSRATSRSSAIPGREHYSTVTMTGPPQRPPAAPNGWLRLPAATRSSDGMLWNR